MKLSRTIITILLCVGVGIVILAMQIPITKSLNSKSSNAWLKISNIWELPEELNEISGIAWLNERTFACIQDEDGIIFIYDLDQNKITDRINFADSGDYEGIAVDGENAFVMRSDGLVFVVENYRTENRTTKTFQTDFSSQNNIESLTFDIRNKRLLIAPKDRDLNNDGYKRIYQLTSDHKMDLEPIVKIAMNEKAFKAFRHKKVHKTFNPSDIAVHPITQDIYILDGRNPKFLIFSEAGNLKSVQPLDNSTFAQPEGITFSTDGNLFISNEAGDAPANIIEVIPNNQL